MKNFTHSASRVYLGLLLKIIICTLWLLCIASAAISREIPLPVLSVPNPVAKTVCAGSNPTFTIGTVSGTSGTVTIQWQVSVNSGGSYSPVANGASYSGATTVTLTVLTVSTALNGNLYRCVVTDNTGSTTSGAALLTVNATPAVSSATRATTVCDGATGAGLQVFNDATLSYQWQVSANNGTSWSNATDGDGYTGGTTYDLTYPAATLSMNGYLYRYIATNTTTSCSATSIALDTLYVLSKPVFSSAPTNVTICPGGSTSFTAAATGGATIAYQWEFKATAAASFTTVTNDAVFGGAQTNTLQLTSFTPTSGNSYQVRLVASYPSTLGCATASALGVLSVRSLPAVTVQPRDTTVCANSNAQFKVTASGSVTLLYQWQTDNGTSGAAWSDVTGATTNTLNLAAVTTALNGYRYRVTVSNSFCGAPTTSNEKTLTVRRSGTWYGTKDIKWEEPLNWCGGVPDNTIDVLVPNWAPNMPTISDGTVTAFFKSIEIENTARLTISGGTVDNMTGPYNIVGTVAYTATRNQNIFPANHGSLEINGTDNKYLGSNVDVSHNLVLGGTAKLVTSANIITMKTGSNTIVAAPFTDPASSWIVTGNGNTGAANTGIGGLRIEQIDAADGAVLFPIGPTPSAYNPIQLTNAGTVDNFTIAVNDQMIPGGVYAAGVPRTWLVSEAVPNGSSVTLSLKWQGSEEQSSFNRAQTMIIRSNGAQIVETTASAPASGTNPYARAGGSFITLTQFSVASSTAVLPMELRSFTAQKAGNAAVGLTWNMTGSAVPKYFKVQRSDDGIHFMNIGQVNGETGKTTYNYTDNLPGTGTMYYRLQVTGQQNDIAYSGVQTILLNNAALVQLRPSATTGSITQVFIQTTQESVVSIYITDITGRIHGSQSVQVNKGDHLLPLWIGGLNKGVYYVHVKDPKGNASVLTLVKQ
jgi:hypothetical protein